MALGMGINRNVRGTEMAALFVDLSHNLAQCKASPDRI